MRLHARIEREAGAEPAIARVSTVPGIPSGLRDRTCLLLDCDTEIREGATDGYAAVFVRNAQGALPSGWLALPPELNYLVSGDILRVNRDRGELRVVFRRRSPNNSLFFTERCNSYCLMCSQPPRIVEDGYRIDEIVETIGLIDPVTGQIGITGGEPTLQPDGLLRVLRTLKDWLPHTSVYCLTNGRLFVYPTYLQDIADVKHEDLIFCVPLYSDIDEDHDFIVQARGAFDQTVRGLLNCGRCGVRVEVRVVIHRANYERIAHLAEFIARNLPFVDHVALMGLEITGFTRANLEALWVDPVDYQEHLARAVQILTRSGLPTSIYNHQHCVIPQELWGYARQSISDWKNEYHEECRQCAALAACGGFFASSSIRSSRGISTITPESWAANQRA